MTAVGFTPRAGRDLEEIWDFMACQWGPDQADRFIRAILSTMEGVAMGIRSGGTIDQIRPGYSRIRAGTHLIFYRSAAGSGIDVVRVLHERMDVDLHL